MRDYYEILNVSKDADVNTIKKAYRKVAMKYHPDKNPGDKDAEEKFKEAAEAYGILNDTEKRQRYDQFGHAGVNQGGGGGFQNMDMNDIFSSFGFSDVKQAYESNPCSLYENKDEVEKYIKSQQQSTTYNKGSWPL